MSINEMLQYHPKYAVLFTVLTLGIVFVVIFLIFVRRKDAKAKAALEEQVKIANAANAAKTNFLFNMSHDIRTPMNAILGYAEILKKHMEESDPNRQYVEHIYTSGEYLMSLIGNVLETARIESGRVELNEEVICIRDLLEAVTQAFRPAAEKKNLELSLSIHVGYEYIYSDSTKVNQILLNVMNNAIKYTPAGKVDVTLQELPGGKEGWITHRITVKDTGIGISKEFLPQVFDLFARERSATDSKIAGTGLGLRITKKLVERMGGTIAIDSEQGNGTAVVITLPHRIAPAPVPENIPVREESFFEEKRILLAEDNDLNAEIAIAILSEVGFEVERAEDGVRCIDMLSKQKAGYYSVILMDVQMPNMNGLQATREIRRMSDPEKANIPIVAMTANAFEEDRRNCLEAGMNEFLAKPIDIPKLLETLTNVIK